MKCFNVFLSLIFLSFLIFQGNLSQAVAQNVQSEHFSSESINIFISGFEIHPEDPFKIDFLFEYDDRAVELTQDQLFLEAQKQVDYFMTALTASGEDLWVNLSPDEPDRLIGNSLAGTKLGLTMLQQDLVLKKEISSLLLPDNPAGNHFWRSSHSLTDQSRLGRVWIVPGETKIFHHNNNIHLVQSDLALMSESLSSDGDETDEKNWFKEDFLQTLSQRIQTEPQFLDLRKLYRSVLLASYYKASFSENIFLKTFADQKKLKGYKNISENFSKNIYEKYQNAFNSKEQDLIYEHYDPLTNSVVVRNYVSGGVEFVNPLVHSSQAMLSLKSLADQYLILNVRHHPIFKTPRDISRFFVKKSIYVLIVIFGFLAETSLQAQDMGGSFSLADTLRLGLYAQPELEEDTLVNQFAGLISLYYYYENQLQKSNHFFERSLLLNQSEETYQKILETENTIQSQLDSITLQEFFLLKGYVYYHNDYWFSQDGQSYMFHDLDIFPVVYSSNGASQLGDSFFNYQLLAVKSGLVGDYDIVRESQTPVSFVLNDQYIVISNVGLEQLRKYPDSIYAEYYFGSLLHHEIGHFDYDGKELRASEFIPDPDNLSTFTKEEIFAYLNELLKGNRWQKLELLNEIFHSLEKEEQDFTGHIEAKRIIAAVLYHVLTQDPEIILLQQFLKHGFVSFSDEDLGLWVLETVEMMAPVLLTENEIDLVKKHKKELINGKKNKDDAQLDENSHTGGINFNSRLFGFSGSQAGKKGLNSIQNLAQLDDLLGYDSQIYSHKFIDKFDLFENKLK